MTERIFSPLLYVFVGVISLLLAIFITSHIVRPSHSQSAQDLENTQEHKEIISPEAAKIAVPNALLNAVQNAAKTVPADNQTASTSTESQGPIEQSTSAESPITTTPYADSLPFLEPYVFDTREGRRNPFRLPRTSEGSQLDPLLPGTPLEHYDLDELKLAGIMWDIRTPKAMIIDPNGEVHILGKDERIGRKHGYVAAIREGEVVVVEMTTFNGENTYSTRVLHIGK